MPLWRKILFALILVALVLTIIAFWGTIASGCCLLILIQSFQVYLFGYYANDELAKTFQEDGQHVKGWRS